MGHPTTRADSEEGSATMHRLRNRFARSSPTIIALACILVLAVPGESLAITWGSVRTLTTGGDAWGYPGALAVSSSTTAHAVFEQVGEDATGSRSWGVYYRRSTSSGSTWETPLRLSRASVGEAGTPTIDASGNGVNAVWLEGDDIIAGNDAAVMTRRSTDAGVTWGPAVQLNPDLDVPGYPRVARSGSKVAVAWTNARTGKVTIRISTDGGATWGAAKAIATSSNKPFGGTIYEAWPAVAWGTGMLYVGYTSASRTVRILRSSNTGASWSSATLSSSADGKAPPSVAATGSTVMVGYGARSSTDYWTVLRRSTDKGAHWGGTISLNPSSSYRSWAPVLAVRGSRWMAVYEKCSSSTCSRTNTYYRASTSSGSSWSSPTTASSRKRTWAWPGDVDVAGKTLVLYMDASSSATDVYVRQGS
jgi:hypothetical protein